MGRKREKEPFVLFSRKSKGQTVYYYYLKDEPKKHKSTKTDDKFKAYKIADEAYKEYLRQQEKGKDDITLKDFIDENKMFVWEKGETPSCPYILERLSTGKNITFRHARNSFNVMKQYIYNSFLAEMPIKDISRDDVKKWHIDIAIHQNRKRSADIALGKLNIIFKQALDKNIINTIPSIKISYIAGKGLGKEKGIFTPEELGKLFPDKIKQGLEIYYPFTTLDEKVMFLFAYLTGARRGEQTALQWEQINFKEKYIIIDRAWKNDTFTIMGTPKNGKTRFIPFSNNLENWLLILFEKRYGTVNQYDMEKIGKDFVFIHYDRIRKKWSRYNSKNYMMAFYQALYKIGIDREERRRRNLTPHSFRHTINTELINAEYNLTKIRSILGWSDERIQENYTHININHLKDFIGSTDSIYEKAQFEARKNRNEGMADLTNPVGEYDIIDIQEINKKKDLLLKRIDFKKNEEKIVNNAYIVFTQIHSLIALYRKYKREGKYIEFKINNKVQVSNLFDRIVFQKMKDLLNERNVFIYVNIINENDRIRINELLTDFVNQNEIFIEDFEEAVSEKNVDNLKKVINYHFERKVNKILKENNLSVSSKTIDEEYEKYIIEEENKASILPESELDIYNIFDRTERELKENRNYIFIDYFNRTGINDFIDEENKLFWWFEYYELAVKTNTKTIDLQLEKVKNILPFDDEIEIKMNLKYIY